MAKSIIISLGMNISKIYDNFRNFNFLLFKILKLITIARKWNKLRVETDVGIHISENQYKLSQKVTFVCVKITIERKNWPQLITKQFSPPFWNQSCTWISVKHIKKKKRNKNKRTICILYYYIYRYILGK